MRRIFERYLTLGSVGLLKAEPDRSGARTPIREHRNGKRSGGTGFSRGQLYGLIAEGRPRRTGPAFLCDLSL